MGRRSASNCLLDRSKRARRTGTISCSDNPLSTKCCHASSNISSLIHRWGLLSTLISTLRYRVKGRNTRRNEDLINSIRKRVNRSAQIQRLYYPANTVFIRAGTNSQNGKQTQDRWQTKPTQ